MADETRKERAERIAREVLEKMGLLRLAIVEECGRPGCWRLIVVDDAKSYHVEFETHPSDENMRNDLRRKLRDAIGS